MSPPTVKTENKYGLDWVLLNNRWYCVQNYSPTHLADGTPIPIVTDGTTWAGLTTPARCVYNNSTNAELIAKYGELLNWHAVAAGLEMPCADCVVPSSAEWDSLIDWMIASGFNWDGTTTGNKIGKALSSSGGEWAENATAGHPGNDQQSNNSSGFTNLPGGLRSAGNFINFTTSGYFWSADSGVGYATGGTSAELRTIDTGNDRGMSIRISRPYVKKRFRGGLEFRTISKLGW